MLALQSTTLPAGLFRPHLTNSRSRRLSVSAVSGKDVDSSGVSLERRPSVAPTGAVPAVGGAAPTLPREQRDQQPPATSTQPPAALTEAAPANGSAAPAVAQRPSGLAGMLSAETWGKLCLLGVAALWGSYNPMLRLVYSQDGPPGPVAIMLFRGVLQAAVLVTAFRFFAPPKSEEAGNSAEASSSSSSSSSGGSSSNGSTGGSSGASSQVPEQLASAAQAVGDASAGTSNAGGGGMMAGLTSRLSFTAIAATELGMWLFLATGIQTLGLQLTTATRAGFLIQATTLITPVLATLAGARPSRNVWAGCVVALAGCLAIAADRAATDADDGALFSLGGDAAILSAAFFFSLATVRLGAYARAIPAVELAAAKSVVLGGAALATFLVASASMMAAGEPLTDLWPGWDSSPLGWAVLCYAALGPGALAAFLHAKGQSVVPPADAQVIFSSVPLWSLAFAFVLLGGEPMSEKTVAGGLAVVAAGIIASRKDGDEPSEGGSQPGAPEAGKGGKQA